MDDFLKVFSKSYNVVICACLLLFGISATQAQTLNFDTAFSGSLDADSSDSYDFIAQEGQMLSFLVTSDTLDSVITIADLSNNILIANDDYDYPNSRDALVEAFSAPYTGSYTLTVSSFGATSGAYELRMFAGYSQIVVQDTFDGGGWQTVDVGSESPPDLTIENGALNLSQSGIDQRALALGLNAVADVYYVQATFQNVTGGQGWRVGLVFQYQDVFNYYAVFLNHNGAWRMVRVEDGEETIVRDWGTHPAIRPGVAEFSLSLLVNGSGYDIFYNEQFVGSQVDDTFSDGQVGFAINTVEALGSTVTAQIGSLLVTSPIQIDDKPLFPMTLTATNSTYTAHELERRLVIPAGGSMALNIPESFAQQVDAGVSRFPVARESQFTDFVMGATVSWAASGAALNGCGLIARDAGDTVSYTLAYVDSTGGYGLGVREGETFTQNIFQENSETARMPYQLLLIAVDDNVYFYINGNFVGNVSSDVQSGGIGEAVVNFEAINTECRFTNLWVWTWD